MDKIVLQMGVAGDVYVMDAAYATAQQFAKFTPAMLKKFLVSVQVNDADYEFILHSS